MPAVLVLAACSAIATRDRVEPSFVSVKLGAFDPGTAEAPLPFSSAGTSVPLTVETLDVGGARYAHSGPLSVSVRPGIVVDPPSVDIVDGAWSGVVTVKNTFGPARIWFSEEDTTDGRLASFAVGVTDALHFQFPTIAELQAHPDHETNHLDREYAEIRVDDREVVVTARDAAGFWAADLADAGAGYSGIFVYTFQEPDDALVVGAKLTRLDGIDQEYLASTQLSFPTVQTDGTILDVPAAVLIDGTTACDDDAMEKREATRVRVEGVTIPATFVPGSAEYSDYESYGQWPIAVGSCTMYAESASTVPDFHPTEHVGATLAHVEGMLKEVYGKWILVVLESTAIGTEGA
jgi:hypothetical protein